MKKQSHITAAGTKPKPSNSGSRQFQNRKGGGTFLPHPPTPPPIAINQIAVPDQLKTKTAWFAQPAQSGQSRHVHIVREPSQPNTFETRRAGLPAPSPDLCSSGLTKPATVVPTVPPLVAEALDALLATGFNFQYKFRLGNYCFDLAFPHLLILIELDGTGAPPSRLARARNINKTALAKSKGWRVIHVCIGPDLVERILDAIFSAVYLNEQTD